LEGFSGTGKTALARLFERDGWLRIPESAHLVPEHVPLADRANTLADYALVGAVLSAAYMIAQQRAARDIVAEGYFLSDLAYFKVRQTLGTSTAFTPIRALVHEVLRDSRLIPDLYAVLRISRAELTRRQAHKLPRDQLQNPFFADRYYEFLYELHREFGPPAYVEVASDGGDVATYQALRQMLATRGLLRA
jgi:hypothetical protein